MGEPLEVPPFWVIFRSVEYDDDRSTYGLLDTCEVFATSSFFGLLCSGIDTTGLGFSAIWTLSRHYLMNVDAAVNHLGHLPADSQLVERASGHVVALSFDHAW